MARECLLETVVRLVSTLIWGLGREEDTRREEGGGSLSRSRFMFGVEATYLVDVGEGGVDVLDDVRHVCWWMREWQ